MSVRGTRTLLLLVLTFGGIGNAAAELSLNFGVESFRWREFDSGAQLLEETGPRYRVGGMWRQPVGVNERDYLNLRGALYFGRIDYDGQACTLVGLCTPFQTDADYVGTNVEALFEHRVGATGSGEVFGGGGLDTWRRDIKGSGSVAGAIEDWTVLYFVGGGGRYWTGPTARTHARAGLKYPFYASNVPDSFSVTLEPKGRLSLFARLETDFISAGRPRWGLGIYYDSYRFAASDVKQVGSILIFQPESKQDVVGIFATVYLR
jgi:hypothetical protein